ncbi:unnamed protein product [Lupinus luteus]|uniref:Uncharacterized protein n=1 Tax=Lupinus luteus TaxID=3873 RepID=A0AAV1XEN6_LUPLU
MRRKLQATKQKKLILSDEVRFMRQRYKYLLKNPSLKSQPKEEVPKLQKLKTQVSSQGLIERNGLLHLMRLEEHEKDKLLT